MLSTLIQAFRWPVMPSGFTEPSEAHVPGALLRTMLAGQFREMRIDLRESGGSCSVGFPSALGLPSLHFRATGGRVALESHQAFVSLRDPSPDSPHGVIVMEFWLTPVDGIGNPARITVQLSLAGRAEGVPYDRVDVSCTAGDESLDRLVATTVEAFFYWAYTREAIREVIGAAIRQHVGSAAPIQEVSADQSRMVVRRRRQ